MSEINRRRFLKYTGAGGISLAAGLSLWGAASARSSGRVVIVGGGFGGATCAKYLRHFDPQLTVTLVEPKKAFVTCPFSNAVLGGIRDLSDIRHDYQGHERQGINVLHASVVGADPDSKKVKLSNGQQLEYDKLVVSPGIDFRWDELEGVSANDSDRLPHAWNGGPQTIRLRKQLTAMRNGGIVIIAPPANPFRCPPGPYERASLIADYLKKNKPKSKILILDAKEKFSKQALFMQGWEELYPGMIEWIGVGDGGSIDRVDVKNRTIHTVLAGSHKGDVINLIPPQKAGAIAHELGLTDSSGWCPVDQRTFASQQLTDIHVIGDASIAGAMPKSGFAANSQAKVCAAAIVSELRNNPMPAPSYVNTCYSLVGPQYGISVAAVYEYKEQDGRINKVQGAGGVSPMQVDPEFRKKEARYAKGWYASITADAFG